MGHGVSESDTTELLTALLYGYLVVLITSVMSDSVQFFGQ